MNTENTVSHLSNNLELLRRVQQCESSRALVVLVLIFILNVISPTSVQCAPKNARIVEIASDVQFPYIFSMLPFYTPALYV